MTSVNCILATALVAVFLAWLKAAVAAMHWRRQAESLCAAWSREKRDREHAEAESEGMRRKLCEAAGELGAELARRRGAGGPARHARRSRG